MSSLATFYNVTMSNLAWSLDERDYIYTAHACWIGDTGFQT